LLSLRHCHRLCFLPCPPLPSPCPPFVPRPLQTLPRSSGALTPCSSTVGAENFSPLPRNPRCVGQPFLQWAGKRRIATPRAVSVSSMRQCPETRPLRSPRPPRCREHDSRITRQTAANARATFPCTVDARLRRPSWVSRVRGVGPTTIDPELTRRRRCPVPAHKESPTITVDPDCFAWRWCRVARCSHCVTQLSRSTPS
jgi:hypothetical protein